MIKTPVNQKILTNVAIVRLKKAKRNFELACYRNKVIDWRNKREDDLGEVLQVDQVFADVAKGIKATKDDLKKQFPSMNHDEIIMEILNKGDFQVSELEREDQFENLKLEIANMLCKMCVNSETGG